MAEDQLFYVGQKAVIDKDGEVLVLNDPITGIDLPGGKIQIGETDFLESLKREVQEETDLAIEIKEPFYIGLFDFPAHLTHRNAGKKIFLVMYKAKYLLGDVRLSDEHNKFKWVDKNSYKSLKTKDKNSNIIKALDIYFNTYE